MWRKNKTEMHEKQNRQISFLLSHIEFKCPHTHMEYEIEFFSRKENTKSKFQSFFDYKC